MKKLILGLMLAALGANADLVDINGAKVERNTPYDIVDGESGTVGEFLDVGGFAMRTNVYDKSETDAKIDEKVSSLDFYKKSEVDAKIADEGVKRQDGDTAAINSAKTYIDDKLKTYEASPDYAAVSNAAMTALQPAATNGLVTASVTNGLASAASVSAAVASATNGLASQSSLTSLSSRVDDKRDKTDLAVYGADGKATTDTLAKMSDLTTAGVLNSNGQSGIPLSTHLSFIENGMETIYKAGGVNFWNGREVYDLLFPTDKDNNGEYTIATTEDIPTAVADLSDAGDYLKTADLAAKETYPSFNAWTNGNNIVAGYGAEPAHDNPIACSVVIGREARTGDGANCVAIGYEANAYGTKTVAIGANANPQGNESISIGVSSKASGEKGIALGHDATASAYSFAVGSGAAAKGGYAVALGYGTTATWGSVAIGVHRDRTGYVAASATNRTSVAFAYYPNEFWLGSYKDSTDARTLQSYLDERATTNDLADVKAMISATDATFSSAVLQVGIGTLGITTNDLQVVHDLAELPVGTSITTVGGLLAALAAGLAALKKKTDDIKSSVDSANAALEEVA